MAEALAERERAAARNEAAALAAVQANRDALARRRSELEARWADEAEKQLWWLQAEGRLSMLTRTDLV